jgi:thioredoxin 1
MDEFGYVTDDTFQTDVLESDLPVLIDFTAAWCSPCKMLAPIIEELAQDWEGKVKVAKLDVDSNQSTAIKYGVMGVPTLMLFKDGEIVERLSGFKPKKHLEKTFSPHL